MILGSYPCCDGDLAFALPEGDLPKYGKEACPHCGATVWHRFSRLDPESFTEEQFLERYRVDEGAGTVTDLAQERHDALPEGLKALLDDVQKRLAVVLEADFVELLTGQRPKGEDQ